MKRIITLLVAAVMILTVCIPVFAAEVPKEEEKDFYPILGSWKLNTVYNLVDGQEPEEIKEEEAQSLYGTGINIFTFDEEGYAHDILFAGPDTMDAAAEWKTTKPNVYVYTEEDGMELTFTYEEEKDVLHRYFEIPDEDATYKKLDFVYARAVVGSWKLDQVLEIHEGDAPVELKKEENQSLYAEAENVLTFELEGKVKELVKGGGEETTVEGTWEMPEPDKFVYTIDTLETEMEYFRVDDTLYRDVKAEGEYIYPRFIYVRAEDPEKEDAAQTEFDGGYAGYNYTDYDDMDPAKADKTETTEERWIVNYAQDGSPIYSDDPRIDYIDEDGFPRYKLPEDAAYIVDYAQDGSPIYSDDPRIDYIDEDGFPRYKLPEDAAYIVDYAQDGSPIYSDDPRIDYIDEDGFPRYKLPEDAAYIVDYAQDGSPIYSDDPRIDYIDEDGFPRYKLPEDAIIYDEG